MRSKSRSVVHRTGNATATKCVLDQRNEIQTSYLKIVADHKLLPVHQGVMSEGREEGGVGTRVSVSMHTCVCGEDAGVYVCVCLCVGGCVCVNLYMCVCVCACVYVGVCAKRGLASERMNCQEMTFSKNKCQEMTFF